MKGKPKRLKPYLSTAEVIEMLPISRATFYLRASKGELNPFVKRDKKGRYYYVLKDDLPALKRLVDVT